MKTPSYNVHKTQTALNNKSTQSCYKRRQTKNNKKKTAIYSRVFVTPPLVFLDSVFMSKQNKTVSL